MEYKRLDSSYILCRLDPGDEIITSLKVLAEKENITLAMIQGLGAVNDVTLGVFRVDEKRYYAKDYTGDFEIVSLTGTIDRMKNNYYSHFHLSIGGEGGTVIGGHLNRAVVSATAEIVITLLPGEVNRDFNETIGLNLWSFS